MGFSQIAAWDFNGESSPATSAADVFDGNLSSSNLITRGATATSSSGSNSFRTQGFKNEGISTSNTDYFEVTLGAATGYAVSLSTIDAKFNGTASFANSPGVTHQFAYSLDGITFTLIGTPQVTVGNTTPLTQIDVSGVSALQSVAAGTTITLRYYASGQTTTGGWGFYSVSAGSYGLAIGGAVNAAGSNTSVEFVSTTGSVAEDGGPINLALHITNPDPVNSTTVTISTSGATTRVFSFTTPVIFGGGSIDDENVVVTLDDDAICNGDEDVYFSISGITGGQGFPFVGANHTDTLTVIDNEALGVPVATTPAIINSEDFTATWNASAGATGYELDVYTDGPIPTSELFFSQYMEGSVGTEKYLEIYNGTGATVDLSDYTIQLFANGNIPAQSTDILSGTLANGQVMVYRNSSSTGYPSATPSSVCNFNGDDGVLLLNNVTGDTLDIIGRIGEDPGTEWAGTGGRTTKDGTLVRNSSITGGVTSNPAAGFPTLDSEWTPLAMNSLSDLGSHTYSGTGETMVSGSPFILGNVTSYSVTGLTPSTHYFFRVRATGGGCPTTINSTPIEVVTAVGIDPILTAGTLEDLGAICLNADGGPFAFHVDGTNLTAFVDVTVAALSGFTYSTTEFGTYTASLSIPQTGGTFSQDIWVTFTPTLEQNYDGDITVGGGGASDITVAATGDGINTPPTMATSGTVSVGMDQAEVSGSLTDEGCSALTDYGIEYSTSMGFTPGTGTPVSSTNISGGNFSSTLTGLDPCTTYYYVAYGTNNGGTSYGTEESFTTDPIEAPEATMPGTINTNDFTATWNAAAGATGYRLDVSTLPLFGTPVVASELFISEYVEGGSNNKYIEIFNGTGASVNLSNYSLTLFANGVTIPTTVQALSGTLANGATIVYANSAATAYVGTVTTTGVCNFNGDDALLLMNTTTGDTLDIIGKIGEDPGTQWTGTGGRTTLNKTLVRNPDVTGGVTANPPAAFPTLDGEWAVYAQDDVSYLGAHAFNDIDPYFLPGYEDLAVGGTSQSVTGLNTSTTYYFRVRAESGACASANSNTIDITTLACPGNSFVVAIHTDANGDQTSWEVLDDLNASVAYGGPYTGQNNTLVTETVCIGVSPVDACYTFHLYDGYGDGLTGNGYWQLRTTDGKVFMGDDFANGYDSPSSTPAYPAYGSGHSFCLPPGPAQVANKSCGIFNYTMNSYVYCRDVAGATSYQFEFSDPDAGFIRRIAVNTNKVRFNQMHTSPLTPGVKYFVRVRTNEAGPLASAHFGTGCEVAMSSTVPCTELISAPTYGHSCGEERAFNTNNSFIYALPVVGATEYQFRIFIPSEGYDETFIRSTYILQLKWNNRPPMVNGSTYNVQVNVKVGATYSGFCGQTCTITINNGNPRPEASMAQATGTATMWPNPVRESQVNLSIDGIQDADQQIIVDIQNVYGKQVFAKEFGNSGERFTTILDLPSDIASGVYLVNFTVNGQKTVQRLSILR
ncbi:MAG: lamin tail domain-containing protein [Flavobacteriales bacterium]|nr:lamin tail domain-containing protein [Flavobacteriales bacterium]